MKKFIYSILAVTAFGMSSCSKDFFDINQNPNSPTENSVSANLLLPRIQHQTANRMATSYAVAGRWMGYWSRSGTYGANQDEEGFNLTTGFEATQWSGWFDVLKDVNVMESKGVSGNQPYYVAIAKIMKSIGFMYLVDQYNNVPYTKAFDIEGNLLPAYDKGVDIYADLFKQLDEAQSLISSADIDKTAYDADVVFGAKPTGTSYNASNVVTMKTSWRRFINTLRLKLLIHESEVVSAQTVSSVLASVTADGSGFIGAGQTANVQTGYAAQDGQQNPFYNTYKITALGATDAFNRANNYALNKYRNNGDLRYTRVYSQATTPLNGNTYYGYNFGQVLPSSDPYKAINSSDVAGPGLAKDPAQPQWLFTSVESLFLQAEAIQRGWLPGDAKIACQSAISESFVWLGLTSAQAQTYYTQVVDGTPSAIANWDGATNKLNFIVMQKYLALAGINNFEAWVDYRRLGIPADLPASLYPTAAGKKVPTRLLYPNTEYSYNAANVGAEGTINAQTSRIFWDPN